MTRACRRFARRGRPRPGACGLCGRRPTPGRRDPAGGGLPLCRGPQGRVRPPTWPSSGILQVDGYSGFKSLLTGRPPTRSSSRSVGRIAGGVSTSSTAHRLALGGGGAAPDRRALQSGGGDPWPFRRERRTVRQERSKPLVEALHAWLTIQLGAGLWSLHSPRRSATPCATGRGWCCSSRTAGSSWTRTSSSGRSGQLPSAGRTPYSPGPMVGSPLGDRGQPGGDREAQRRRAPGVAHRRA